jgi:flavin-dependent dehydrogenase
MDCIVVGAGSAGALAAWLLARRGLSVTLVDRRPRDRAGASWFNDVERGLFDEVGLGPPPAGVVVHEPPRFVMTTPCGSVRQVVDRPPAMGVDMKALCAWLWSEAESAGVTLRFGAAARIGAWRDGRREVVVDDARHTVPVVVDASGLAPKAGRNVHGGLDPTLDLCSAYQAEHVVSDPDAARRWREARDLGPDEILSTAGVEGGYSILHVALSDDDRRASILTGALQQPGRRSGPRILDEFVASEPWVGKRIRGGGGLIPLRQTAASFVDDGLVRLGNAAGQVFPPTGSGVALGLRAAVMASDAVAEVLGHGGPARASRLWAYNVAYQREVGAVCAAYQPMRYLVSSLPPESLRTLLAAGVVSAESIRAAYENAPFPLSAATIARAARHLPTLAPLLPAVTRALSASAGLDAHYRRFPRDPAQLGGWAVREAALMRKSRALATPRGLARAS